MGGSKSRVLRSSALWLVSRRARCQALMVDVLTPRCWAISEMVSLPAARSRSRRLGSWRFRRSSKTMRPVKGWPVPER